MYGCQMLLHLCPHDDTVEGACTAVKTAGTPRTEEQGLQGPWVCRVGGGRGEDSVLQPRGFFSSSFP